MVGGYFTSPRATSLRVFPRTPFDASRRELPFSPVTILGPSLGTHPNPVMHVVVPVARIRRPIWLGHRLDSLADQRFTPKPGTSTQMKR